MTLSPTLPSSVTHGSEPAVDPESSPQDPTEAIIEVLRDRKSGTTFFQAVLPHLLAAVRGLFLAVEVRRASEVIRLEQPADAATAGYWRATVQGQLTRSLAEPRTQARLYQGQHTRMPVALLSAPLLDEAGRPVGALVVATGCADRQEALRLLGRLRRLARLCSLGLGERPRDPRARAADPGATAEGLRKAAGYTTSLQLSFALTNNLRNKAGCEQVALGLVRGPRVQLKAVSGMDEVKERNPGVQQVQAAMEECLDLGQTVVSQREEGWAGKGLSKPYRLHRQWHEQCGGAAVASVPLRIEEVCVGVLSLRRRAAEPFTEEQLEEYRKLVEPFLPAMQLVDRANRRVGMHIAQAALEAGRAWASPGHLQRQLLTVLLLVGLSWFLFGTMEHQLTVPCAILPAEIRHLGAPADAVLKSARVSPGDPVAPGDVLCEFDTTDLVFEAQRLAAELTTARIEERQAMTEDTPGAHALASARRRHLEVQRDLVQRQIDDATIRAPFQGIVLSGDVRRRVGDVFARGEPLFELSPAGSFQLELNVPEADARHVQLDQTGLFASFARPEVKYAFRVVRMRPIVVQDAAQNVFVLEADVELDSDWLRGGMEGVAEIDAGRRRVCWLALHGVLDAMRLRFWL